MSRRKEIIETFNVDLGDLVDGYQDLLGDLTDSKAKPKLVLNIDATHSGRLTNNRVYPGVMVRKSVGTFTFPKGKPVLKNHDSDKDPIGRVTSAKFKQLKQGKAFELDYKSPSTGPGSGVITLGLEIMDEDSIEKFLDGRYQEFSTRQSFDGFFCSVCGNDYTKDTCGHYPGDIVNLKGKDSKNKEYLVYGITGPLSYKEVSVVNIPADAYTNINEMEMVDSSFERDFLVSGRDDFSHGVSQLLLASSVGTDSVNLLSSGKRRAVTSKDRELLTGKTIFSIAGPDFKINQETFMETEKKEEILDQEVENLETQENTDAAESSKESSVSESSQETESEDKSEGVEAPQVEPEENVDETEVSDLEVAEIANKLLVSANKKLEDSIKQLSSELERVKGQLTLKDEEIERLRNSSVEAQAQLKESTARQLLDNKLTLGKLDTADVKDKSSYDAKLAELSQRSIESLNDALIDLSPELSLLRSKSGMTKIFDKQIADPVLNLEPAKSEKVQQDKESKLELSPAQKRNRIVDSHLN